jgi:hypothetical protein
MQFHCPHKRNVRAGKIAELIADSVGPLHAMKEVVPKSENDDQQSRQNLGFIICTGRTKRFDRGHAVVRPQMKILELRRKLMAVISIAGGNAKLVVETGRDSEGGVP